MILDISTWKKFKIKDLFEVTRGKRIVKNKDYSENKNNKNIYPVITAKTINNGVDGYYSKYNCEGNVIVCGGEASGMISFYQKNKCWVMDRSRILKPKFNCLNENIALFLIPLLNKWSIRFSYGNSANPSDIKELYIKLPVDNNNVPDWQYMVNYIKYLIEKNSLDILDISKILINNSYFTLDVLTWKEFKLKEIFEVSKTKDSSRIKKEGNIPYVSRKGIQNGVVSYKKVTSNLLEKNCLTIHSEWSDHFICFYHDGYFCADGKIVKLINNKLNKYNGLFICTILSKIKSTDYKLNTILNTIIKLPVDADGKPNWEYMENYIKSLPYSKYI